MNPYVFRIQYLHVTLCSPTSPAAEAAHEVRLQKVEGGFPHSEIPGSKLVRSSPRLIAAYHVLHRLSAPRHPPNALKTLDRSHDRCPPLGSDGFDTERPSAPGPSGPRACLPNTSDRRPFRAMLAAGRYDHPTVGRIPSSRFQTSAGRLAAAANTLDPDRRRLVEPDGIEPTTSCLQSRRSPN